MHDIMHSDSVAMPCVPGRVRSVLRALCMIVLTALALCHSPATRAACTVGACVTAGARLASVDSTRGALLNALLGNLLGSTVNLTVADWNSLAQTNLNLANFMNGLQAQTTTGSPAAALGANATLLKVFNAAALGASADGSTAAASILGVLAPQVSALSGTFMLGDMLKLTLPSGMLASSSINALDLVTGTVELFNYSNVAATSVPVAINVTGAALGLSGTLSSVKLSAKVIEAPVIVCGAAGTTFHTAAIRVKLDMTLVSIPLNLGGLLGLSGITAISADIAQLGVYVEVARADGVIQSLNAVANSLVVRATPGVADIYIGSITDANFWNRNRALSFADVSFGTIGSLSVTVLVVVPVISNTSLQIRTYARGQSPFFTDLSFSPPWPQTKTASTSALFLNNMLNDLVVTNLQVQLSPSLLGLDAVITVPAKPLISAALNTTLGNLLPNLVDPLLQTLGIRIGAVDVTVSGMGSFCSLSGYAYSDLNHNGGKDGVEAGCGTAIWAKLVPASAPSGPATDVVSVNTSTGDYSFSNVMTGTYTVLIDNNATLSDVTAGKPTGWLNTETPTGARSVTMATADVSNQNFGLFNGSQISGTVFKDNGISSGTANNVVKDGGEQGLVGVAIKLTDNAGTTTYDVATTSTAGAYTLWVPPAAGATALKITETNPPVYISTGGNAGNTGGTYARATDTVSFTHVSGSTYTGVNFADVPDNAFSGDNSQTVLPGAVAFHPHVFIAGSAGQLTLALSGTANPVLVWTSLLYRDTNCNGVLDTGEVPVTGAITVAADDKLCFIVRTQAPATAPYNAQYSQTLSGSFTYANSVLTWAGARGDVTLTGSATDSGLVLTKSVDKATALPGETLTYTIRYENRSSGVLSSLKINDMTPSYTVYASAGCGSLPVGISACVVTTHPAVGLTGALLWTLTGNLTPGAFGLVSFSVVVQ
ncbi:hypothetical protein VVD49_04235 [Uliginosibacterium sp. H3]|uniref:DUF11 domain-containing protein n=1 Tax=Uliginosibacterium silvisoli TaxID=3114758 RepID=A0ABU6JZT3_9RHOO|nr:hypothetical protein [Uliginosibacterium sp. H3]